jgi:hypothetical protein
MFTDGSVLAELVQELCLASRASRVKLCTTDMIVAFNEDFLCAMVFSALPLRNRDLHIPNSVNRPDASSGLQRQQQRSYFLLNTATKMVAKIAIKRERERKRDREGARVHGALSS